MKTLLRRTQPLLEWLVPGAILVLVPKCPACLAAYIAVSTGIGLSFTSANYLRWTLLVICVVSLSYFGIKRLRRLTTHPRFG